GNKEQSTSVAAPAFEPEPAPACAEALPVPCCLIQCRPPWRASRPGTASLPLGWHRPAPALLPRTCRPPEPALRRWGPGSAPCRACAGRDSGYGPPDADCVAASPGAATRRGSPRESV